MDPAQRLAAAFVQPLDRVAVAVRREAVEASPVVADFYRAHDYRPLWIEGGRMRSEAHGVAVLIERAAADGLDPAAYSPERLRAALAAARTGEARALARAELALSAAYATYISDLHRPPSGAGMDFWDAALEPALVTPRGALETAAAAPDLASAIAEARRMHPIYERLRAEAAARPDSDPLKPLILANMARARALPADPGARYVLVDAAAQRLWLYENGLPTDTMRVIVGTPRDPTPVMAGLMRYANYRPYWNIPVDVAREEIAPHVLREGPAYLEREEMEVLSDWSRDARVIDPAAVDWDAVASGAVTLRVRRRPGEHNILGEVKLMLPNRLGIYLHDTPNKQPFSRAQRTLSHGCIRLEDAQRLTRRLVGPVADDPPPGDDVRVDLPQAVPVYVVYFTVSPTPDGLERRRDVYGRDVSLLEELGLSSET